MFGQVGTIGEGTIRVFGGNYGWVWSHNEEGGRVEVFDGASIGRLSSRGVVLQKGGEAGTFWASDYGVSVLDHGEVHELMSASELSTLVLAGGYPASDIHLYSGARLIILHMADSGPDRQLYSIEDFDRPGASTNSAGKEFNVDLDGSYKGFLVSAWTNSSYLGHNVWWGQVELARVGNDVQVFRLHGDAMMLAFRAPGNEVIQLECSTDLVNWNSWKSPFPGGWDVRVELIKTRRESQQFFRLRKWPKPGA